MSGSLQAWPVANLLTNLLIGLGKHRASIANAYMRQTVSMLTIHAMRWPYVLDATLIMLSRQGKPLFLRNSVVSAQQ